MVKIVTEETHDLCTLCGGRGQESSVGQSTAMMSTCRQCGGGGRVLTKTVTRREEFNLDELADAVSRRLTEKVKAAPWPLLCSTLQPPGLS